MQNLPRTLVLLVCVTLLARVCNAQWPTDITSPLILGDVLGFGSEHTVVSTPDGATWVAWIDNQCFPSLLVQRIDADGSVLTPDGLVLDTQDSCINLSPRLTANEDNTVIAAAIGSDPLSTPVHRITPGGQELWTPAVVANDGYSGGVHAVLSLPGGDILVVGRHATSIRVGRYAADGSCAWNPPADFATGTSSNMRIFGLEPDGADGAWVLWDTPGAYTRRVYAMRITAQGTPAWQDSLLVVDIPPGSSRHTDPVAMADGTGGLVLVWTQGAEQATTPVPLRMQRLLADGSLQFDVAGQRVSTASARQFDVQVRQRVAGGDIYVAWRDGQFDSQSLRAQRMTLAGQRLWGDTGVLIKDIAGSASQFSTRWLDDDTLAIAITDAPDDPATAAVQVYRIDVLGQPASAPWPVAGTVPAGAVNSAAVDDALAVVWQRDATGSLNEVVAQRVNLDGTLGLPDSDADGVGDATDNCTAIANPDQLDGDADGFGNICDGDLNNDCVVNVIDLGVLKSVFFLSSGHADLNGDGIVNVVDLGRMKLLFFAPPGPSGLPNACD